VIQFCKTTVLLYNIRGPPSRIPATPLSEALFCRGMDQNTKQLMRHPKSAEKSARIEEHNRHKWKSINITYYALAVLLRRRKPSYNKQQ